MDFAKVGVRVLSFKGNTNEQSQANISTTAEINISVLSGNIEGQTLALIGTFSVQAMWKLLSAEGEKGVLIWAGSADSQGVYALVSSLGSLFVRIILQPFEVCLCGIQRFFSLRFNHLSSAGSCIYNLFCEKKYERIRGEAKC
jgi:hypothetical protein